MYRLLISVGLGCLGLCIWMMLALMERETPASRLSTPPPQMAPTPPAARLPAVSLPSGTDPESVALRHAIGNGERIYQQLCYYCHGRQGKGDNNAYMESRGHKPADHTDLAKMQKLSDWEFFLALRDGVKDERGWFTMPPWASVLTSAEMWDVIIYVRRLPAAPPSGNAACLPSQE